MSILDPVSDIYIYIYIYIYHTYRTPMTPMRGSNFLARSKLDTLLSDGLGLVRVIKSGIFARIKEILG